MTPKNVDKSGFTDGDENELKSQADAAKDHTSRRTKRKRLLTDAVSTTASRSLSSPFISSAKYEFY